MKPNPHLELRHRCRALAAVAIGLALVLSTKTARAESTDLSKEIADLQAQVDRLSKEIEPLKTQVYLTSKRISPALPDSFHTDPAAIQISRLATAWTKRPSASGVGDDGILPLISFDLKNIGAAPITDINLIVSFYKTDKEVIGGATIGLLDASAAPLRTGMWQRVTIDPHFFQFPNTRSIIALNADLYLQTAPGGSYVLIDTFSISPRLEP